MKLHSVKEKVVIFVEETKKTVNEHGKDFTVSEKKHYMLRVNDVKAFKGLEGKEFKTIKPTTVPVTKNDTPLHNFFWATV